jgi:hypothetical protein
VALAPARAFSPHAFRYRVVANDCVYTEELLSNVEYVPGDELPLRSARWEVERVVAGGVESEGGGGTVTLRTLYCDIR